MKLELFDKYTRIRVDMIRTYDYVTYSDVLNDRGSFEIRIPTNEVSLSHIKIGNFILFENDVTGIIKQIKDSEDDDVEITVKGYLVNHLLEYRSFLLTTQYYNTINLIARQMVTDLFISPSDSRRKINFITLASDSKYNPTFDSKVRIQNTGDTLLDYLTEMLEPFDLGFELHAIYSEYDEENAQNPNLNNLEFRLLKPVNRTVGNSEGNTPVVFSFDMNNLELLEYEEDDSEFRNVALVAGEGTGGNRLTLEVGDSTVSGIDRIELYVDARDIQSDEDPDNPMTDEEMQEAMQQRGNEKLADCVKIFSFETTVLEGRYKYGRDFFLADYVTVVDKRTKTMYDMQVTAITKSYSSGVEHLDIQFGKDKLKIRELKERRMLNNG